MRFFSRLSDREADAVLAGKAPAGSDELQELAAFFRDARVFLTEPPATPIAAAHLAAIAGATRASDSRVSEPQAAVRSSQRRPRNLLARPARVAVAAAALALLAAFGGAAYAGVLPDPVQGKVADIASNVGLSLPGNANDVNQGDVGNQDQGNQRNSDQGDQGNQDQGAQGNKDEGAQGNVDQGAKNNKDEGAQANKDEGAQGNKDEGAQGNTDGGAQANTDEGAQGNQAGGDRTGGGNGGQGGGGNG
jgi:hypothetical protein